MLSPGILAGAARPLLMFMVRYYHRGPAAICPTRVTPRPLRSRGAKRQRRGRLMVLFIRDGVLSGLNQPDKRVPWGGFVLIMHCAPPSWPPGGRSCRELRSTMRTPQVNHVHQTVLLFSDFKRDPVPNHAEALDQLYCLLIVRVLCAPGISLRHSREVITIPTCSDDPITRLDRIWFGILSRQDSRSDLITPPGSG